MFSMAGRVNLLLLVTALLVPCVVDSQTSTVTVGISHGYYSGTSRNILVYGNTRQIPVETYWGIRYAYPPIRNRRFNIPEVIRRPISRISNATVPPKACLQKVDNKTIHSAEDMSEDCLYFNVWRPQCNYTSMATLVYIHGGSLRSGSSTNPLYNGEYLAARECVIVATFNYRLGALGFLYVDTPGFQANVGLFDVIYAIQAIKNEIPSFSGDRSKITVFGSGTGAFLASAFVISSHLRGEVNSVILQSGSPAMHLLYQSRASAEESAVRLAADLSCNRTNKQAMVNCLRRIDARLLTEAFYRKIDGFRYRMVAVNDGTIIRKDPIDYLKNQEINNVSLLIGTNKNEVTESLMKLLPGDFNRNVPLPSVFSTRKINRTLRTLLGMVFKSVYFDYLTRQIPIVYNYNNRNISSLAYLSRVTLHMVYTCPMKLVLDAYAAVPRDVYVYSFNHAPDNTRLPAWVGATHRAELDYIFGNSTSFSPREILLSNRLQRLWANFAKYGNPTPKNTARTPWPRYTNQTSERMLVFKRDTDVKVAAVNTGKCYFWNAMPSYLKVE